MNFSFMLVDFTSFFLRLQRPHVIVGLILAIFGLATIFLARRIATVARKEEEKDKPIEDNNKLFVTIKAFGLVMLLISLIIMVFE